MSDECETSARPIAPPPQHNYEQAAVRAVESAGSQPADQLEWLGARREGPKWVLPVLDDLLSVEMDSGRVWTSETHHQADPVWRVLTLHYLAVSSRPSRQEPSITFAQLGEGRAYAPVYQERVIGWLCRKIGRRDEALARAAAAIGGRRGQAAGGAAWDFRVFPRVRLRLVWYGGDEELAPSAVLLLPANIGAFFCTEDIVVLSERLIRNLIT